MGSGFWVFPRLPGCRLRRGGRRRPLGFVTAALPEVPICARKLDDRTSQTSHPGALLVRHRLRRSVRAAAPPECRGGASEPGRFIFSSLPSLKRATLSLKRARMARRPLGFVTAALPEVPICARKLDDRTSQTSHPGALLARHRLRRSVRAAAPPECRGGASEPGRFIFSSLPSIYKGPPYI